MKKEILTDEFILGMHKQLVKQASGDQPDLVKAADCLHAALEILEDQGLQARADQVLQVLEKIGQNSPPIQKTAKIHSLKQLMEAGVTQHDLKEFARGNPMATAKLNLVLRKLGLSDHEMAKFLGHGSVMTLAFKSLAPETAPEGQPGTGESLEFKSLAVKKKPRNPGRPDKIHDPATKGLTPAKEVKNLLQHGHPLNVTMSDDGNCAVDVPPPVRRESLNSDDMADGFEDLMNSDTFDIGASDDELMNMEIKDDSLEVSEKDIPLEDFEDERD